MATSIGIYHSEGCEMLLARVTTISPLRLSGNNTFYAPCGIHRTDNSLCLIRIEAEKLAQAGFGHFLADTRVRKLKGNRDENKEVYFVDTIFNSAGHII